MGHILQNIIISQKIKEDTTELQDEETTPYYYEWYELVKESGAKDQNELSEYIKENEIKSPYTANVLWNIYDKWNNLKQAKGTVTENVTNKSLGIVGEKTDNPIVVRDNTINFYNPFVNKVRFNETDLPTFHIQSGNLSQTNDPNPIYDITSVFNDEYGRWMYCISETDYKIFGVLDNYDLQRSVFRNKDENGNPVNGASEYINRMRSKRKQALSNDGIVIAPEKGKDSVCEFRYIPALDKNCFVIKNYKLTTNIIEKEQ